MKLRVNLLKEGETRYQGPVSIRFLTRAGGGTIIAFVTLFTVMAVHHQLLLRHNVAWSQAEWQRISPHYDEIKKKQEMLGNYKGLLDELQQWGSTNTQWNKMFLELQQIVPPSVQLSRISINTGWVFIKPPAPPPKADLAEPPKELPQVPARKINLSIAGKVNGELGDEVVVQFTRGLHKAAGFDTVFDTMKLQSLFKDSTEGKELTRQFVIEGQSNARKLE